MSIKLGNNTFNNGGTANFNDGTNRSLSEIRYSSYTVWKKETIYEGSVSVNFPFYAADATPTAGSTAEKVYSFPVGSIVTINSASHVAGGATYQRFYIFVNGTTYVWGQQYNSGQNSVQLYALGPKEGGWSYSTGTLGPYTITTTNRSVVIGIQGGANAGAWQYGPDASHSESVSFKFTVT